MLVPEAQKRVNYGYCGSEGVCLSRAKGSLSFMNTVKASLFLRYSKDQRSSQVILKYALDISLAMTTYQCYPVKYLLARNPITIAFKKLIISFTLITLCI